MTSPIFTLLTTTLKQAFAENASLNAFILLYYCCNCVKHSKKFKNSIYNEFKNLKFTRISSAGRPASQPAVRPGSTSAMALEFLHNKGNRIGFTKLLFRRTFIRCTMVLPFILY